MFFQNHLNLEGRLTRTPELQKGKSGKEFCRFGLCYNQQKKNQNEEWESIPHFFNCVCFGKTALSVSRMEKGEPVTLVGKLQFNQWIDKESGERHTSVNIIAETVKKIVIEKRDKSTEPTPEPFTKAGLPLNYEEEIDPNEIPF